MFDFMTNKAFIVATLVTFFKTFIVMIFRLSLLSMSLGDYLGYGTLLRVGGSLNSGKTFTLS